MLNNNNYDDILQILEKYENDIAEIIVDGFISKDEKILGWIKKLNNYYYNLSSLKDSIASFYAPPKNNNNNSNYKNKKGKSGKNSHNRGKNDKV